MGKFIYSFFNLLARRLTELDRRIKVVEKSLKIEKGEVNNKRKEKSLKMAEFKKVRSALKFAIRKNQESFLLEGKDWEIFDGLVDLLLGVVEDLGLSKKETIALYEELKREIEEELKVAQ